MFVLSIAGDPKWMLNQLLIDFAKPTVPLLPRNNIQLLSAKPAGIIGDIIDIVVYSN